jgi:hypothetical protein
LRHAQVPFEIAPIEQGGDAAVGGGAEAEDGQGGATLLAR